VKIYEGANIRNVALVGHSHSGKTSLTSAMLFTVTPFRAIAIAEPVSTPNCIGFPAFMTGFPSLSTTTNRSCAWLAPGTKRVSFPDSVLVTVWSYMANE